MIRRIFGGEDNDPTCSTFFSESRTVSMAPLSFVSVSRRELALESDWSGGESFSSGVGGRESGRGTR